MSETFDVCIRGAGVVGRTLALLLAKERLRVALVGPHAQATSATPDIRAYSLNSASRRVLESVRAWPEASSATPVVAMQVWGDDGGQLRFAAPAVPSPPLNWIVDVPALEQQLAAACQYQSAIELVAAPVQAPLTLVCEGQKSSSRSEFNSHWVEKSYGQQAIAARLQSSQAHCGVARQWFKAGDVLALLPLGGPSGSELALVWSVANAQVASLKALSQDDFCAALQAICGEAAGQLKLISERSSWPLNLSKAQHWVGPGWALAGDAAHSVHPLAGQGLNLGLGDAACLARVLAEREYWRGLGEEKLLRRYERARKAEVAAMALVTDGLHTLFAQPAGPLQGLRNWGMNALAHSPPVTAWLTQRAAGSSAASQPRATF